MAERKIRFALLAILCLALPAAHGQTFGVNVANAYQCYNLQSGVCRSQCLTGELDVFPYICSFFTVGTAPASATGLKRCVTSMPCCYWSGTCQTSCTTGQVQLSSAATCDAAGSVCCIPSNLVTNTTPTLASATTTTTTTTATTATGNTVAARQGVCGSLVTNRALAVTSRMIGGTVAQATSWPWMVRITFSTSQGFCSGVLVNSNTVVTAAHCVQGVSVSTMRVILGEYDVSTFDQGEEVVNVATYSFVNGYVRGIRGNDFAVIKLSRAVTFTNRKLPACLPDPTIPLATPSSCYVAGWGVFEQGLGGPLRAANVRLLDRATCQQRMAAVLGVFTTLPADIICTDNPTNAPVDGCLYDDGDMLVCRDVQQRWSLIGVLSEYSCGRGLPVLFSDVRVHTNFVLNQL